MSRSRPRTSALRLNAAVALLVLSACAGSTSAQPVSPADLEPTATPASTEGGFCTDCAASQTVADAQRDGVTAAIAGLSYDLRVDPLVAEASDDATWVLSQLSRDVIQDSMADGCRLGPVDGDDLTEVVCTSEYGEILLTNTAGRIQRAFPMPGAVPSWIYVSQSAVYAGRIGDGGLPDSTLVRIDRATLATTVVLVPTGIDIANPGFWPAGWRIASEDDVAVYRTLVGFAPAMVGTAATSWIGDVVIDLAGIDAFIDSFEP